MVEKNDFTIYRKYEDDGRYFDYNYDMIINRILEVIEGYGIEDKIEEYIDDLEEVVEQMVDEFNVTISDLDDLQEDYDDLEEEKEELIKRIEELEEVIDFAEEHKIDLDSAYIVWRGLDSLENIKNFIDCELYKK